MKAARKNRSQSNPLKEKTEHFALFFGGIHNYISIIVPSKTGHVQIACARKGTNESVRFFEIDFLRGAAVLMMVVFHFFWDTNFFGYTNISLYEGFFGAFQKLTAGTFLFLVGVSLAVSHSRKKENFEKKFLFRSAKIFGLGALITLFSLLFFPSEPIFFGVLHLIAVSIALSVMFVRKKNLNLILGLLVIFSPLFFGLQSENKQGPVFLTLQ